MGGAAPNQRKYAATDDGRRRAEVDMGGGGVIEHTLNVECFGLA